MRPLNSFFCRSAGSEIDTTSVPTAYSRSVPSFALGVDFKSTSVRRTERYVTTTSEGPEVTFVTPRALISRSIAVMMA